MKHTLTIVMAVLMAASVYGQSNTDNEPLVNVPSNQDSIFLNNHGVIMGKVKEITDDAIKYVPEGEELISTIGMYTVNRIVFSRGGEREISPTIIIEDAKTEWDKVAVAYEKNAVKGMRRIGSDTQQANSAWSKTTKKEGLEAKVFEKLKKECARQGGVVLFVVRKDSQSQGGFGSYGFAEISVDYYAY